VGDTTKARMLFDDREIEWQLGKTPNTRIAGADLLIYKANEFARQADVTVGDVSKAFSKVAESMKTCAEHMRSEALKFVLPFFGGLTISGKEALSQRTDDVQPAFSIGMTDSPGVVQLNRNVVDLFDITGGF
jgi:hypothetical protein